MKATVIAIGDELLAGYIVNNNAAHISTELARSGIETVRQLVVGDDPGEITAALNIARGVGTLAVCTGGLGPTPDDVTLNAVAEYFGRELVLHRPTLEEIERHFARRKVSMPDVNVGQAMVPAGAKILRNPVGTAPGVILDEHGFFCCLLPGVPDEMEIILSQGLVPFLEKQGLTGKRIFARALRVIGVSESGLYELVSGVSLPTSVSLGFYPDAGEILLRFSGRAVDEASFTELTEPTVTEFKNKLGDLIYAEGENPLEYVLGKLLRKKGKTLAAAESCTGGLLGKTLTDVAGSSNYFLGSAVTYSNEAKIELLGVKPETLETYGAVSEETAAEMAEGARRVFGADYGVAITGVAGPGGGTPAKPVGTVCFGLSRENGLYTYKDNYLGDRTRVRHRATLRAMDIVRLDLLAAPEGEIIEK
jgi:nicotinamide-nucleotide amidase